MSGRGSAGENREARNRAQRSHGHHAHGKRGRGVGRVVRSAFALFMAVVLAVGLVPVLPFGDQGVAVAAVGDEPVQGQQNALSNEANVLGLYNYGRATQHVETIEDLAGKAPAAGELSAKVGIAALEELEQEQVATAESGIGSQANAGSQTGTGSGSDGEVDYFAGRTAGSGSVIDGAGQDTADDADNGGKPGKSSKRMGESAPEDEVFTANAIEDAAILAEISDDERLEAQLAAMDFSSQRIVVALAEGASIQERDLNNVEAATSSEELYVLSYKNVDAAKCAYVRYLRYEVTAFVAPDMAVEAPAEAPDDQVDGGEGADAGADAGAGQGAGASDADVSVVAKAVSKVATIVTALAAYSHDSDYAGSLDEDATQPADDTPTADLENYEEDLQALDVAAKLRASLGREESERPLVALVDTAVAADSRVEGRMSVLDERQPEARSTDEGYASTHGDRMLATILAENPGARVISIEALDENGRGSAAGVYTALNLAVAAGADIVNMSFAGFDTEGNAAIGTGVEEARETNSEVVLMAAAGNAAADVSSYVPAALGGVTAVGATDAEGNRTETSNYGDGVDLWACANSTSYAAARASGALSGMPDALAQGDWLDALAALLVEPNPEADALAAAETEAARAVADGSDVDELDGVQAAEDDTVYHTVSFNTNGYGVAPEDQKVADGETLAKPEDPSLNYGIFGGWFTDQDCRNAYDFSAAVTSDFTLYAKWMIGSYDFGYTGEAQTVVLLPGTYKLEVWGAQGGYRTDSEMGGKGGYSTGELEVTQPTRVFVRAGGSGNSGEKVDEHVYAGGFNGGGYRYDYHGGGGASDIRIGEDSLYARVIVAGGGGSDGAEEETYFGGYGGGTTGRGGGDGGYWNSGGTQTNSGDKTQVRQTTENLTTNSYNDSRCGGGFGFGGAGMYLTGVSYGYEAYNGAGGGGWYGGSGSTDWVRGGSGGGGSGYVYTADTVANYPSGCTLDESYYLSSAETIAGDGTVSYPSPTTQGETEAGHIGDGYARITLISNPASAGWAHFCASDGSCSVVKSVAADENEQATAIGQTGDDGAEAAGIDTPTGFSLVGWTNGATEDKSAIIAPGEKVTVPANGNVFLYPVYEREATFYSGMASNQKSHGKRTLTWFSGTAHIDGVPDAESLSAYGWSNAGWTNDANRAIGRIGVDDVDFSLDSFNQSTGTIVGGEGATETLKKIYIAESGLYYLDLYGAQGGNAGDDATGKGHGGYGGHSYGYAHLDAGTVLYVTVGGSGLAASANTRDDVHEVDGGYNGGGVALCYDPTNAAQGLVSGSGGGATHVASVPSELAARSGDYSDSVYLVAGGGGGGFGWVSGSGSYGIGGSGGGLQGLPGTDMWNATSGNHVGLPGAQEQETSAGTFGAGAPQEQPYPGTGQRYNCGGGGGFFGGGYSTGNGGAGGGSGFVNSALMRSSQYGYETSTGFTGEVGGEAGHTGAGTAEISFVKSDYSTTGLFNTSTGDTFYALYTRDTTLNYDGNGATSGNVESQVQKQFSCTGVAEPSTVYFALAKCGFERTGYGFLGWTVGDEGSKYGFSPDTTSVVLNTTALAKWAPAFDGGYDSGHSVKSITLVPGKYKLEVWGAQGGYRTDEQKAGRGGYSYGVLTLSDPAKVYIRAGGAGGSGNTKANGVVEGGFNGGGYRYDFPGGGGASDIRIGEDSLYARVIVAGGGGSDGATNKQGMYGGGVEGGSSLEGCYLQGAEAYCGKGGTATAPGSGSERIATSQVTSELTGGEDSTDYYAGFGFGGAGILKNDGYGGAGGGGWYGGSGGIPDGSSDDDRGGGGGSGYVYTAATAASYPSGCKLNSSYYLSDAATIGGDQTFLSPAGESETGHVGDGYVRITPIDVKAEYACYCASDGSGEMIKAIAPDAQGQVTALEQTGVGSAEDFGIETPKGFHLVGWTTDDNDPDAERYAPGTPIDVPVGRLMFLYPVYERDSDFISGLNTSPQEHGTKHLTWYGGAVHGDIPNAQPLTQYGWEFEGWAYDAEEAFKLDWSEREEGEIVLLSGSTEPQAFYAVYSRPVWVTYDGNEATGGTLPQNTQSTQLYCTGDADPSFASFTLAESTLTKTDFTFAGWTLGAVGSTYTGFRPAAEAGSVQERTVTAKARWAGLINCDYTGLAVKKTLEPGTYKLEAWGAQGGYRSDSTYGGKGGYSYGTLTVWSPTDVYIYAGGAGGYSNTDANGVVEGGFNGGGYRYGYPGGGGASDIRIGEDSLYARVLVAGGGGSDGGGRRGKYGGGESGGTTKDSFTRDSEHSGQGGGQTPSAYYNEDMAESQVTSGLVSDNTDHYAGFGFGGGGIYLSGGRGGAGGGGWYGGFGTIPDGSADDDRGGGGGSGYVYTAETAESYPSGCKLDSSYYLSDAATLPGGAVSDNADDIEKFPSPTGGDDEAGHEGNGYVRISCISLMTDMVFYCDSDGSGTVKKVVNAANGVSSAITRTGVNGAEAAGIDTPAGFDLVAWSTSDSDENATRYRPGEEIAVPEGSYVYLYPVYERKAWFKSGLYSDPAGAKEPVTLSWYGGAVQTSVSPERTLSEYGWTFEGWADNAGASLATGTGAGADYLLAVEGDSITVKGGSGATGALKSVYIAKSGLYYMDLYGAQGGSTGTDNASAGHGGYGGHTYGYVHLDAGTTLYVVAGGSGGKVESGTAPYAAGGYNGGGRAIHVDTGSLEETYGSGGGATHVASVTGTLEQIRSASESDDDARSKLYLVAGGGGGGGNYKNYSDPRNGGSGGGLSGGQGDSGYDVGKGGGATQLSGGADSTNNETQFSAAFGVGAYKKIRGSGGGGGLYGGGSGGGYQGGAGGGSGYVNTSLVDTNRAYATENTDDDPHTGAGVATIRLESVDAAAGASFTLSGSADTFWAMYSRTVQVSYDGAGSDGGTKPPSTKALQLSSTGAAQATAPVFILAKNTFKRDGFEFLRWSLGVEEAVYSSFRPSADSTETTKIAYARWAKYGDPLDFAYKGAPQPITLDPGAYKMEVWGASGGGGNNDDGILKGTPADLDIQGTAGAGGYTYGMVTFPTETTVYVYTGRRGAHGKPGRGYTGVAYNGGAVSQVHYDVYHGGGGMTHISLNPDGAAEASTDTSLGKGSWGNDDDGRYGTLVLAGGGGGADDGYEAYGMGYGGASGGGFVSSSHTTDGGASSPATETQTTGNARGVGQTGNNNDRPGGGGGWYGGYSGQNAGTGGGGTGHLGDQDYFNTTAGEKLEGTAMNAADGTIVRGHVGGSKDEGYNGYDLWVTGSSYKYSTTGEYAENPTPALHGLTGEDTYSYDGWARITPVEAWSGHALFCASDATAKIKVRVEADDDLKATTLTQEQAEAGGIQTPAGFTLVGWAASAGSATVAVKPGVSVDVPSDDARLFYPVYERTATLKSGLYRDMEKHVDTVALTWYGGYAHANSMPQAEPIDGWTAIGWTDDPNGGTRTIETGQTDADTSQGASVDPVERIFIDSSDENLKFSAVTGEPIFYAVYTRNVKVTYAPGDHGSGTAPADTVAEQQYCTGREDPTTPVFKLAKNTFSGYFSYAFDRWSLGQEDSPYVGFTPAAESSATTKTAYAWWKVQGDFSTVGSYSGVLSAGKYKLEVWGAQGGGKQNENAIADGYDTANGGLGGYSYGIIDLQQDTSAWVYVGGHGLSSDGFAQGGFNGGGAAWGSGSGEPGNGGGGASDIRLGSDSLYARLIVAGGGGGGGEDSSDVPGYGGGESGGSSGGMSTVATQTSTGTGGVFGSGASTSYDGGGGGGGWYGGGTSGGSQDQPTGNNGSDTSGGAGGSGYVYTSETAVNYPSGCLLNSSYYLTDAATIPGNTSFDSPTGDSETGHAGDGFVRITKIGQDVIEHDVTVRFHAADAAGDVKLTKNYVADTTPRLTALTAEEAASESVDIVIPDEMTELGYTLAGWATRPDSSEWTYAPGDEIVDNDTEIDLYPVYTRPITFVKGKYSASDPVITVVQRSYRAGAERPIISPVSAKLAGILVGGVQVADPADYGWEIEGWGATAEPNEPTVELGVLFEPTKPSYYLQYVREVSLHYVAGEGVEGDMPADDTAQQRYSSGAPDASAAKFKLATSTATFEGVQVVGWSIDGSEEVWPVGSVYDGFAPAFDAVGDDLVAIAETRFVQPAIDMPISGLMSGPLWPLFAIGGAVVLLLLVCGVVALRRRRRVR